MLCAERRALEKRSTVDAKVKQRWEFLSIMGCVGARA